MKVKNVIQMMEHMESYNIDFVYNLFGVFIVDELDERKTLGYYAKNKKFFIWYCEDDESKRPMMNFVEENIYGILNGWSDNERHDDF